MAARVTATMEALFPGSSTATFTPFPVVHPSGAPAYALRVECGAGSSGTHHLDDATLAAPRARLGGPRLVLSPMGADMLAPLDRVDAEVAEDGRVIALA